MKQELIQELLESNEKYHTEEQIKMQIAKVTNELKELIIEQQEIISKKDPNYVSVSKLKKLKKQRRK